jgi:nucleoside-diphosphate-sugar epimerase
VRVFITGAAGFIGAHVVNAALRAGGQVYALVRDTSDLWRLTDALSQIHVVRGDLASITAEALRVIQPEICIHAAWYAVPGKYLSAAENVDVLRDSLHLAQIMAQIGCRRFVGIGTCFEYDTTYGYLGERSALLPRTMYAASKTALFQVLAHMEGLNVAWARLFYQYGPYEDRQRLVPAVITRLLDSEIVETTTGEQIRDYLHVQDVADAVWDVAVSDRVGPVNIGSGNPIRVRQIVETIAQIMGRPDLLRVGALPQRAGDPPFICADNTCLRTETGWTPRYTLEDGLQHTIDWWRRRLAR